ncbi:Octaprenyl diphosphate synthase [hydrothermal vent metagenome]|uniref:Octaprenyl diphosphate synthase n=1 Tax=hydrothermal vent metagenome TaxID=652676 RepID=A0A3B0YET6_9ZZZZ
MLLTNQSQNFDGLEFIKELISVDFQLVNELIQQSLKSDVVLIDQLSHYIIGSGGKRLRPLLVLLSARAAGYEGKNHINVSAIIEFIHTATLLHDDVVDASELRRGQETANSIWGNEASVLVGDFLYSRAFQMMVSVNDMRVMEILSDATNTIAEGEVMQLLCCGNPDTTEAQYLNVIYCKTAKLFEAGCQLGAILGNQSSALEQALQEYGKHLGTAFQLIDDALDYNGKSEEIGKNLGDDLAEGKPTLPLIYTMHHGTEEQSTVVREAIEKGGLENIEQVTAAIKGCGALEYTQKIAVQEQQKALSALSIIEASPYKEGLEIIARFSVERKF